MIATPPRAPERRSVRVQPSAASEGPALGEAFAPVDLSPSRMTVSEAAQVAAARTLRYQQMLEGDEIVQLALKPSIWYIGVLSWRWVLGVLLLHACVIVSGQSGWTLTHTLLFQGGVLVAAGRVGYAVMQWASRWYLLTNRRVMRMSGVLRPEVRSCLLTRVGGLQLRVKTWQRVLRVGSVQIKPAEEKSLLIGWNFVQNPGHVHGIVEAAVGSSRVDLQACKLEYSIVSPK